MIPSSNFRPEQELGEDSAALSSPPVVVRLAGLPAGALTPLTSPACIALLKARQPIEEELDDALRVVIEKIGKALPTFDAGTRRFMLEVRRGCFNGRSIEQFRGKPEWTDLLRISAAFPERILFLQKRLAEHNSTLTTVHENELNRERLHVLEFMQDKRFLRGVALHSGGLVQKALA